MDEYDHEQVYRNRRSLHEFLAAQPGETTSLLQKLAGSSGQWQLIKVNHNGRIISSEGTAQRKPYSGIIDSESSQLKFTQQSLQKELDTILSSSQTTNSPKYQLVREAHSFVIVAFYAIPNTHWFTLKTDIPKALITIRRLPNKPPTPTEAMHCSGKCREMWRLTKTESKVAHLIASGATARQTSEQLDITYQTARSYLKSCLSKSGTHSQNALAKQVRTNCN